MVNLRESEILCFFYYPCFCVVTEQNFHYEASHLVPLTAQSKCQLWDILDLFFRHKKNWNASCKNWSYSLTTLFPDVHYDFLLSVTLAGKNTKVVWKCTTTHIKWLTGELRFDGSLPRVIVYGWIKLHSRMKCLWTGSPQVPLGLSWSFDFEQQLPDT